MICINDALPKCKDVTQQVKWNVSEQTFNLYILEHTLQHYHNHVNIGWWRSTVVERRSLAGELSLSCARAAADG